MIQWFTFKKVQTPDDVHISFDCRFYSNARWANVYIEVTSDYEGKTFGMSGNNNNNQMDELMDRDGNVFQSYSGMVAPISYTDAWR